MNADSRSDEQAAAAAYIASLTASLADLARQQGLRALSHLFDMARLEAESAAHQIASDEPAQDAPPEPPAQQDPTEDPS
jgi:hypothetical protein